MNILCDLDVDFLLADLYWMEYQDTAEEAREALASGDKLKALALAIFAHKLRSKYESHLTKILLSS